MYAPSVIERNIAAYEKLSKVKLTRYDPDVIASMVAHLATIWDAEKCLPKRDRTADEKAFIRNERTLSMLDFRHWARNYCNFIRDPISGGGLGTLVMWGSQERILSIIAQEEERQLDMQARGEPVDGILIALHKARQLGATLLVRALQMHRLTLWKQVRAITASVDDEKVMKLYERDKRILDNLPWWLAPSRNPDDLYDEKATHVIFRKLDSSLVYQELVQKAGIAQGEQYDLGHMTEVASVDVGQALQHHYFPTIPQSPYALHVLETTAQGRDNWWRFFVEDVRLGFTRWRFVFIPWYAEPQKYRRQPPDDWRPSDVAILHAKRVHETSAEYIGHTVMLPRENLYWWETEREDWRRKDSLNLFLTNYCATVDESFQHTTESVFSSEVLDFYRSQVADGVPYEIITGADVS